MDSPDTAKFGRKFAALVRTQGPDPKGLKMRNHAFHLQQSGRTTLSASGILLPAGCLTSPPAVFDHVCSLHQFSGALVVTAASVVEPFLIAEHRCNPSQELFPRLIPDARIDVLVESEDSGSSSEEFVKSNQWLQSRLLALVDISASSNSLRSLVGTNNGSGEPYSWEVGWSLVSSSNDTFSGVGKSVKHSLKSYGEDESDESSNLFLRIKSTTRVAIIGVPMTQLKNDIHIEVSQSQSSGDILFVVGSPFGILSPSHFFNSICSGAVSNCYPPGSTKYWLLLADIRCLSGMEGSPVYDKHGHLIGMLASPLRHKNTGAEIQLVITWEAIAATSPNVLQRKPEGHREEVTFRRIDGGMRLVSPTDDTSGGSVKSLPNAPEFPCSTSPLKRALSSIALITVGDGSWASGILLNHHGLVLTNAHLLEPWRFERESFLGPIAKSTVSVFKKNFTLKDKDTNSGERKFKEENHVCLSGLECEDASRVRTHESLLNHNFLSYKNITLDKGYRKISVRLDHLGHHTWCNASVVYVSKGPMDVALLQLESVPSELCPITPEVACPSVGLPIYVIGHGLFGPQSDLRPSVSSGVVSNVFRKPESLSVGASSKVAIQKKNMPVMLQTTAAVHPGASGGAVVNADGHMIGLVTSNTKHGHRTTIPHMNFSIPCAALDPIFRFADQQDVSILKVLDKPNELLSSIWTLGPPPSSPPVALEKNDREAKGSRFARFLAEKHAEVNPEKDIKQRIKGKLRSKI